MLEPNDLKKGVVFKQRDSIFTVTDYSHSHRGRGSATVTIKARDLITGNMFTFTYRAGDKLEEATLDRKAVNFLYREKGEVYFMDDISFEQVALNEASLGHKANFLTDGQTVTLIEFEGRPIDIDLPPKVDLKVIFTEPGVKGDTASGTAYKPATLDTGYQINVPLFVKQGDMIRVNTETGEYVERVT